MEITFIVGLPGSGKSYFGKQLAEETGAKFFDDPSGPTRTEIAECLFAQIELGSHNLVVADPHLCKESTRQACVWTIYQLNPNVMLKWIYYENDPEQCLKNVKNRDSRKVTQFIHTLSSIYNPPPSSKPVWKL